MRTPEAIAHGKKVQSVYLALKIVLNEESDAIKAADDLTENIAELREHIYLAQDHLKQNPGEYTEKEKASLKEALDLDFDSIYNALANKDILKIPKDSLLTLEKTLISNQKREIMVEAQSYQPIIDAMEIIVSSKDLNDLSTAHGFLSDGVLSDIFGADVATAVLGEKTKSPKPVTSHVLSTLKEQEAAIQRELGDRKERFKDYEKNFLEPMADNLYRIRSFIICSDYSKDLDTGKFTDGGKKIVNWKGLPEDLQDISLDDLDKYAKAQGLKKLSSELAKEV